MSESKYYKLKFKTKEFYYNIHRVYCPCLDEYIIFNAKGFHHFIYDGSNKIRSIKSQVYRMNLLPLVIPVIKQAKVIDQYIHPRQIRFSSKKVEDWSLKSIVGSKKILIKVVLRRKGDGNIFFLSVMKIK